MQYVILIKANVITIYILWSIVEFYFTFAELLSVKRNKNTKGRKAKIVNIINDFMQNWYSNTFVLFFSSSFSLNVGRFSPSTNYDQTHLHPHVFSDQQRPPPTSYTTQGSAGYTPSGSTGYHQALKVPQLEQYPSFPQTPQQNYTASALQQALLSPTPSTYTRHHQQLPHMLQGLLSPRHSLTGHADARLPPADFMQLIKQHQQQQQELNDLFNQHLSQGDAGNLSFQSPPETYHNLLQIRAQECMHQATPTPPPPRFHPSLLHSESMEEDCTGEGHRMGEGETVRGISKPHQETGHGDSETLLGTLTLREHELGTQQYQPQNSYSGTKMTSRGNYKGIHSTHCLLPGYLKSM